MAACNHGCIQNCCITFLQSHGLPESLRNKEAQGRKGRKCLMISVVTQCMLLDQKAHLQAFVIGPESIAADGFPANAACFHCNFCIGPTLCNVCRQYKPWLSMVPVTTQLSCCKPYVVTYKVSRGGTHSCCTLGLQSHTSVGVWHLRQSCPFQGQWMKRPLLARPCLEVCAASCLSCADQLLQHALYLVYRYKEC